MLADQPPVPGYLMGAGAEPRHSVEPELEDLVGDRPRSCWCRIVLLHVCVVLGVLGTLRYYSRTGALAKDDPAGSPVKQDHEAVQMSQRLSAIENQLVKDVADPKSSDSSHTLDPVPIPRRDIIHVVVDRSGSVTGHAYRWHTSVMNGVNGLIQKHREFHREFSKNGGIPCEISVTTFNDKIETIISNEPIAYARAVNAHEVKPETVSWPFQQTECLSAPVDAIFKAIGDMEARSPDGHPTSKRTILIISDSQDNHSKRTRQELRALITQKRTLENPYLIQFLGTGQDGVEKADMYGINEAAALTYEAVQVKKSIEIAVRQQLDVCGGLSLARARFTDDERSKAVSSEFYSEPPSESLDPYPPSAPSYQYDVPF